MEVVETLPAPERISEDAENLPLDTQMSVTPDAEPSSVPEPEPQPQPELAPVQNAEPVPVRRSQRVRRPVVKESIFKLQVECGVNDTASVAWRIPLHYNIYSLCCICSAILACNPRGRSSSSSSILLAPVGA